MESPLSDKHLLADCLESVVSVDARKAAEALIEYAEQHPFIQCQAVMQGYLRSFRYRVAGDWVFAFIFNRSSVLFYIRRPAMRLNATKDLVKDLQSREFPSLVLSRLGEAQIRISTLGDAKLLISKAIEPILATYIPGITPMKGRERMTEAIVRPAAQVRQGQLMLYTTSMRVKDLLQPGFYDIERLDPADSHDKGYQRVLNVARAKRLASYLLAGQEQQDAFLPTSIFLATDADLEFDRSKNELRIDV